MPYNREDLEKGLIKNNPINYGFIEPEIKPEDFSVTLGSQVPFEILQVDGQWTKYTPEEETQTKRGQDVQNCTAFGTNSGLEVYFKRKFFLDVNFSDRYLGIMSGTRPPGNDPGKVVETLRSKAGCVDEMIMPFSDGMTVEGYYSPDPPTPETRAIGREWLKRYYFRQEWTIEPGLPLEEQIKRLRYYLQSSPILVAVYAWAEQDGKHIRMGKDTHWCVIVGYVENDHWLVFDSYAPFLKKLDWNFGFNYAKRFYVGAQDEPNQSKSYFAHWLEKLVLQWFKIVDTFNESQKNMPLTNPLTNEIIVVDTAFEAVKEEVVEEKKPTVKDWALAIQEKEGYFRPGQNKNYPNGSLSFRNCNPGNLRPRPFVLDVLRGKKGEGDFAKWPTYEEGFKALCKFLEYAQAEEGQGLAKYDPEMTLLEFYQVYAPKGDGNDPVAYAKFVAQKTGIRITNPIKIFQRVA